MTHEFVMPPTRGPIKDRRIARRRMAEVIENMSAVREHIETIMQDWSFDEK